jgi:hypothetical protein
MNRLAAYGECRRVSQVSARNAAWAWAQVFLWTQVVASSVGVLWQLVLRHFPTHLRHNATEFHANAQGLFQPRMNTDGHGWEERGAHLPVGLSVRELTRFCRGQFLESGRMQAF